MERVNLRLPCTPGLAVGIVNTGARAALADIQTHAVCCFVPDRRAVRSGAVCCALPANVAHCAARIAMYGTSQVVGLAKRPDHEPASTDHGDDGRAAQSPNNTTNTNGQTGPCGPKSVE